MRHPLTLTMLIACLIFTYCNDKSTNVRNTDEDEIREIITSDFADLFNLDLIDTQIPDTINYVNGNSEEPYCYWKEVNSTSRLIEIDINYPSNDYPYSDVSILDSVAVTINVLYKDTTTNPHSIARTSHSDYEIQKMKVRLRQFNPNSDHRNGWVIEAVTFPNCYVLPAYNSLNSITVRTSISQQRQFFIYNIINLNSLSNIIRMGQGEQRKMIISKGGYPSDIVEFHLTELNNSQKIELTKVDEYTYEAFFNAPEAKYFFHLTADIVNIKMLLENGKYYIQRWAIPVYVE